MRQLINDFTNPTEMKKYVYYCLMALMAILGVSCEGPQGPAGYDGVDGRDGRDGKDASFDIIYLEAKASDWTCFTDENGLNAYCACSFNLPELSEDVVEYGTVLCYLCTGNTQAILPCVRHYENEFEERWTRTIDFEYGPGTLSVYVTNSDFYQGDPMEDMTFRLVIMYAE